MTKVILAFLIAQLINVVLSTLKSVITIKGGKNWAAVANAVAYAFNTVVIKSLVSVSLEVAVAITIVTNLVGVYFGLWVIEKFRKDQLWKITVTLPKQDFPAFKDVLQQNDISFINYHTNWDKYEVVDVFSKQKADSRTIKNIFRHFKVKYTISANTGTL